MRFGNRIHVLSNKYVNEILLKYQNKNGELKKELLPIRIKEHPELDNYPLLNDKYHKNFKHVIGVCQWLIVAFRFNLFYAVSSLSILLTSLRVGHLDLSISIFGYMKK